MIHVHRLPSWTIYGDGDDGFRGRQLGCLLSEGSIRYPALRW